MLCATINGVELEYIVQGSGEPVVLIHGSIYSDSYFPLMAQPILANHYRMINYHRRGFAGSTHPDSVASIRQQATDCNELMETLNMTVHISLVTHMAEQLHCNLRSMLPINYRRFLYWSQLWLDMFKVLLNLFQN